MNSQNVKVVMIGESNAGKSAILRRFEDDEFVENIQTTIGIDFISRSYTLEDDREVTLQVWDTAGQERYKPLMPSYVRQAKVAVVVFDLTDPLAHQHVTKWIKFVDEERGSQTLIFLVGNKSDIGRNRKPSNAALRKLTTQLDVPYLETSAKSGQNIQELFDIIAHMPFPMSRKNTVYSSSSFRLRKNSSTSAWSDNGKCSC